MIFSGLYLILLSICIVGGQNLNKLLPLNSDPRLSSNSGYASPPVIESSAAPVSPARSTNQISLGSPNHSQRHSQSSGWKLSSLSWKSPPIVQTSAQPRARQAAQPTVQTRAQPRAQPTAQQTPTVMQPRSTVFTQPIVNSAEPPRQRQTWMSATKTQNYPAQVNQPRFQPAMPQRQTTGFQQLQMRPSPIPTYVNNYQSSYQQGTAQSPQVGTSQQIYTQPEIPQVINHLSPKEKKNLGDGYGMLEFERLRFLRKFNELREDLPDATNVNILRWNEILAAAAFDITKTCFYKQNGSIPGIFGMTHVKHDRSNDVIGEVVSRWSDEKGRFILQNECVQNLSCRYQQIIWADSKSVGCAKSLCNDMAMFLCLFDPPGNKPKESAYEPGVQRCSACNVCNSAYLCEW